MYTTNKSKIMFETEEYVTYGITYDDKEVRDITVDKERITRLANLLNELELSEIHFDDVIEDFLAE